MTPRAKYLAKVLLRRMATLEATLKEDGATGISKADAQRQQLVAKVLLTELGTTDFSLTHLILAAMPTLAPDAEPTTRELEELGRFLDRHVAALRD